MRVLRDLAELREAVAVGRATGGPVGLVPTMGALHEGHLSLIRAARERCGTVVVSVFVNPTQFGPAEDLEAYPRDVARDAEAAAVAGADIVYAPDADDMYPEGYGTWVAVEERLAGVLCGAPEHRGPSHFRGVTTVVLKLLNRVGPDVAFFGAKDAQQAIVIRRMVRDLDVPSRIEVLPTVREADGLALSSRNSYLTAAERERATAIPRVLRRIADAVSAGETDIADALEAGRAELAGLDVEYLEARSAEDLSPVEDVGSGPVLVAVAVRLGRARLIDNVTIEPVPAVAEEACAR